MKIRLSCLLLCLGLALSGCGRKPVDAPVVEVQAAPVVAGEDQPGQPFEFAQDAGGALLAKTLAPAEPNRVLVESAPPLTSFPAPAMVAPAPAMLHPAQAAMPETPVEPMVRDLKPHLVTNESTFSPREELSLPQAVSFPVPNPVRLVSRDANKALPLPPLAKQTKDHAPLVDPTKNGSARAAAATATPARTRPAPYARIRVGESYEERSTVGMAVPLPESVNPSVRATPKAPGK